VSRQAHITYRSACALEKIPNRVRVHDDSGPAPFQRIRSTLQNIDVPALVSKNQSRRESAERAPNHNGSHHAALPLPRTVGANEGGETVVISPRVASMVAVVVRSCRGRQH